MKFEGRLTAYDPLVIVLGSLFRKADGEALQLISHTLRADPRRHEIHQRELNKSGILRSIQVIEARLMAVSQISRTPVRPSSPRP